MSAALLLAQLSRCRIIVTSPHGDVVSVPVVVCDNWNLSRATNDRVTFVSGEGMPVGLELFIQPSMNCYIVVCKMKEWDCTCTNRRNAFSEAEGLS